MALFIILAGLLYFAAFTIAVHLTGLQDSAEPADIIIVLGAGLKEDGRPGPALTRRTRHASTLWHEGVAPLVLCAGGQSEYFPRTEAAACREILLDASLPDAAILLEERSRSTEENAIYSERLLHDLGLSRIVLVSDSYHMLRAGWLFTGRGVKVMASPVPADRIRGGLVYPYSIAREFIAFNWQLFKELFNIPLTHISGI
ncbi:MAG: YdcF family protein [Chloroflexi bacterium]|nr:YdcF family protein [Chloroflexota bacterium]